MTTTQPVEHRSAITSTPASAAPSPAATPPRAPGSSRGRRGSLRTAIVAAAAPAVLVSAGLFAWMLQRSAAGVNTAGLQRPAMDLQHRVAYWWPFLMGETLGISALIWSYLSVLIGLSFTARTSWLCIPRARLNELHRHVSMTSLLLIVGHVLFVALGSMNGAMDARTVNVAEALLPFQTAWNGVFYNTGVFAFYLAVLLGPTYYLRRWIGVRWWRIAHRASLAVYVLAVWHTFGFDDFDFDGPYRLTLWIAQLPLAALLLWRLAAPFGNPRRLWRTQSPREAGALALAGLLGVLIAVIASGHIGGSANPFHRHTTTHTTPANPEPTPTGPSGSRPASPPGMGGMPGM